MGNRPSHTLPKSLLISLCAVFYFPTAFSQIPSANFTANLTSGCSPLVVNFIDQSTGNPTSWLWDFGNGNTSTLQNPTAIYLAAGAYTVKLTVSNSFGSNTLVRNLYVTVYESPTVNFSGVPLSGCFPLRVQFNDLSSAGSGNIVTNWYWDFGNGVNSSAQNPSNIYTAAGNYSVLLRVMNDKGCVKAMSKTSYINVTTGVKAGFSSTQAIVCRPPATINFTNTSIGPGSLSYNWNFGDGGTSLAQNPSHVFTSGGTFTVTLVATSSGGCFDTIRHDVIITNNTTSINAPDSICVNYPVSFQNFSIPAPNTALWDFADATTSTQINPIKTYTTPGTYLVKLVNNYTNCQDSALKSIKILAHPVSDFTAPVLSKCKPPLTVNFQDISIGAVNWQWKFGDGATSTLKNPTHTYNSYGNFDVTLITTNSSGCNDTIVKPQYIKVQSAQISIPSLPTKGCIPYTINPVANIIAIDTVTSYSWDFGDGFTSTLQSPAHMYLTQGAYPVKLSITTSSGCSDTLIIANAVKVGSKPTADFSATPIPQCSYQPVQFTDLSTTVDEWFWDFGDGGISVFQNPTHSYASPGIFNIVLIASNSGCADTVSKMSYINVLPPVAQFAYSANCANRLEFNFTDQSIGAASWFWDFGDGTTSNSQNPIHDFPSLGTYTVSLTVTNGTCSHTVARIIKAVKEVPDFVTDLNAGCKTLHVAANASSINMANIVNYAWSADGVTFTNSIFSAFPFVYNKTGAYTNSLITTDINGCTDTVIKVNNIRVYGPIAVFSALNTVGCKGLNTTFNDSSTTDGIHPISTWQWDFGDGSIQNFSGPPFQHVYNIPGTYSVKLRITDNIGCMDSTIAVDIVTASDPRAQFTSTDTLTCPNANVSFTNQSTAFNFTSNWDFGDGNNSVTSSPTHAYMANGTYTVKLLITDQFGCSDSLTKNNYVFVDSPQAIFSVSDSASSCMPFEVNFFNQSHYYGGWLWDFGPGVTSTQTDPSYFFASPGTYPVKLIVTSFGGCKDSMTKNIYVYDTTGSTFSYVPISGCKPLTVNLNAFTPGPVTYLWDFGDGTTTTTTTGNAVHVYTSYGSFLPKLIIQSNANCLIPLNGPDTLHIVGAIAKFGIDKNLFCDTGRVNFIDSTTFNDPILSYDWSFGDGATSTQQNPFHQYNSPGFFNVALAVRTLQGCVDTIRKNNLIKIVQRPLVFIAGDSIECIYEPMLHTGGFVIPDSSLVNWSWKFPNGNSSGIQNPPQQTYTASGSFFVTVIATNSTGCRDTATKKIVVNPLPVVNMPGTMTMQAGFPVTIPATYSPNTATYSWAPAATLSCNNCPQPTANPKFNTKYNVVFVDSNGCRNTASVTVVVICKNANVFMPNTFSPNGDGSNDVFYPRGKGINRVKSMRIFDRWGEVVFESRDFPINDPTYGWDGKFKGRQSLAGVFIYQVEFYCDNGEIITLSGDVNLIL